MNISELVKYGYLEDTKDGYIIRKNFSHTEYLEFDKPLIIPKNCAFDWTKSNGKLKKTVHSGKDPFFVSVRK